MRRISKMLVYKITNKINGKIYVGKTACSLDKRIKEHKNTAEHWTPEMYNSRLYPAMQKYGFDTFEFTVLESVQAEELLDQREKFWIDTLNSRDPDIGYNIAPGGCGGPLFAGHKHSEEMKQKSSQIQSGKIWVNNGIEEHMILQGRAIPDGFSPGRLPFSAEWISKCTATLKRRSQDKQKMSIAAKKGYETKVKNGTLNTNNGYKSYTNGYVSVKSMECPEGFIEGDYRVTPDEVNCIKTLTKDTFVALYTDHTLNQVAQILNLRVVLCRKLLDKFGIQKHSQQEESKLTKSYYTEDQLRMQHEKRSQSAKDMHKRESTEKKQLRAKNNSLGQKGKLRYINPETMKVKMFYPNEQPEGWVEKRLFLNESETDK